MSRGYSPAIRSASPRRMAPNALRRLASGRRPKRICSSVVKPSARPRSAKVTVSAKMKSPHRRVDLVGGAGDADDEASVLAEVDVALDDAKVAVVGRLAVAAADLAEAVVVRRREVRQLPAEERLGGADLAGAASGRATCQYQPDSGSSKRGIADGAEVPVRVAGRRRGWRRACWRRPEAAGRRRARCCRDRASTGSAPRSAGSRSSRRRKRPRGGPRWAGSRERSRERG